jgi:hypothetical protein
MKDLNPILEQIVILVDKRFEKLRDEKAMNYKVHNKKCSDENKMKKLILIVSHENHDIDNESLGYIERIQKIGEPVNISVHLLRPEL